ncbi:NADase-type glycan-binding domain-containing protein [Streptomyces althioticus]|uniref:NADase-type glycan-binding domain-containing protein n=1 Tax=Streptomyces althioticus TaxID=83380 RepID=UPI00379B4587
MTSPSSGPGGRTASRCADCGTRAEPGQSFCDSCGAVLGWADWGGRAGRAERARTEPARTESAAGTTEPAAPAAAAGASGAGAAGAFGTTGAHGAARSGGPADVAGDAGAGASGGSTAAGGHGAAVSAGAAGTNGSAGAASGSAGAGAHGAAGSAGASGDAGAVPVGDGGAAVMDDAAGTGGPAGAGRTGGAASADAGGRDRASAVVPPDDPDRPTDAEDDTEPLPAVPSATTEPPRDRQGAGTDAYERERARSLLVPVADSEPREVPEDPDVAPVLPGRTAPRRPQVRAVTPQADAEGGVPCPWCSTPNRPERHFCARCAMSMARGEDAPQRLPWWRRMFADRTAEPAWAGERPRLRRGFGRVWNWVVGAVVIGLVVALVMNLGTMIQATRDHFAKRAPVGPSAVKASRSYTGHGAGLAFDKLNNTWWGPGIEQAAEGEWLEVTFDQPTRLLDLVITPGTSTRANELSESALPRRIDAQITLADGEKITRTLTLDQSAGGQRRSFRVGEVTTVRFVLRSAYGAGPKKQVAIAEIEFFGPSHNNS